VVVTGSRSTERGSRSVVKVDVVTREEALKRGATNVGEALAGELGVFVNPASYGSIGQPSAAQIGGFDRERILVLEDGERVTGDVGGAVDLAQLSLGGVDRIEVVRGPASALFGTSAIGGVINVVTAPPQIEGLSGLMQLEGRHRWGGMARGELAYRHEASWLRLTSTFFGSEGVSLSPPDLALPPTYRVDAGLQAGTTLGRAEFSGRVRFGREAALGLDAQEFPGLGEFLVDLPDRTNRLSTNARSKLRLGEGHELTLALAKQWFWNRTAKDRRDSPIDEARDRFHTMHSAEATGSFFQGEWGSFLVGARGEIERFDQTLTKTTVVFGEPATERLLEVEPTQLGVGALYGQLRADPWDWVSATLGARVEGSPRYGVAIAPRLALAFFPDTRWTVRVNGGRGYRVPTAKEIGFVFDHSTLGYRVIGNPDLAPETSWGLQAEVQVRPVRPLTFRVGTFANWVDELIDLRQGEPGTSGIAGVDDFTYLNVGRARTFGVDARALARASEHIRAELGYSFLWTRDEDALRPLPGRPPHTFLVGAEGTLPFGTSLYARLRMVTDAYLDDETRAPPFTTLDLRVTHRVLPSLSVYAGALNVLGTQKDPRRFGDQRPIEGRTLMLGLTTELPWRDEETAP
jgi:outer membrane receptor for ferrienterochelin and colicins